MSHAITLYTCIWCVCHIHAMWTWESKDVIKCSCMNSNRSNTPKSTASQLTCLAVTRSAQCAIHVVMAVVQNNPSKRLLWKRNPTSLFHGWSGKPACYSIKSRVKNIQVASRFSEIWWRWILEFFHIDVLSLYK